MVYHTDASYKVKDTVLQINLSGRGSPGRGPERSEEPAYVVPTTPSPFLHCAYPPSVPLFTLDTLPPAYGHQSTEQLYMSHDGLYTECPYQTYDPADMQYSWMSMPMGTFTEDGAMELEAGRLDMGFYVPEDAPGTWMTPHLDMGVTSELFCDMMPEEAPGTWIQSPQLVDVTAEPPVAVSGVPDELSFAALPVEDEQALVERTRSGRSKRGRNEARDDDTATNCSVDGAKEKDEQIAGCTTVMLRNIPNKYTREMLIKQLSIDFKGRFDFMYLPIDFKNKCNVGYGFINFRTAETCEKFVQQFNGVEVRKCLPGLNSKKIAEVTPARVQGLPENVRRLRNSPVMNQLRDHPNWMPLLFDEHGHEEPFPQPDSLPVKSRGGKSHETEVS